jgi:hypothetical protein
MSRHALHRMRNLILCIASMTSLSLAPSHSRANDASANTSDAAKSERVAEARAHFKKGVSFYDRADFASAIVEFQRAYALQPAYRLLYNLGQVNDELHDYAAAERHFRAYLLDGGDEIPAERRAEVNHELDNLRDRIASLRLQTDRSGAHLFVDERSVGWSPLDKPVRVNPGRRRIVAEHAGYPQLNKLVDIAAGETLTVKLDLGPPLAAANGHRDNTTASATEADGLDWPLWTGIATGVLAAGSGTLGYLAARDADGYHSLIAGPTTRRDLDDLGARTKREAAVSDVLLGAAIVTGVVTVVLLLTADRTVEQR